MKNALDINIDDFFRHKKSDGTASYRKNQKETIEKAINALWGQDYNLFFMDAPVGFGKSDVIATLSKIAESMGNDAYMTTPALILQDQNARDFPEIAQIKGRANYMCLEDPDINCAIAECMVDESYKCKAKENGSCSYIRQRDLCVGSSICGMNTAYMLMVSTKLFGQRHLFSCDEAHSIPEWGVGYVSVILRKEDLGFIPAFTEFDAYLTWLTKHVSPIYEKKVETISSYVLARNIETRKLSSRRRADLKLIKSIEELKSAKEILDKINRLADDYAKFKEPWEWNIESDTRGEKIVFKPLTSGRFLEKLLWSRGEKILLSSGTITPEVYITEGGLNRYEFDFKDCVMEVPSTFNPKKAPIYYQSMGKMTRDLKDSTFPKIMAEMNKEIALRQDRKGIIHTFSYDNARYIEEHIAPELKYLVYIQDRKNRAGSLEDWMADPDPSVFISTNMTEGLNLKGDLCKYQMYTKIGFPSSADKRVAKRLELGHWLWYNMQAIEDIEQASGRDVRSEEDESEMFIWDGSFAAMYLKYNKHIKQWFKDRVVFR